MVVNKIGGANWNVQQSQSAGGINSCLRSTFLILARQHKNEMSYFERIRIICRGENLGQLIPRLIRKGTVSLQKRFEPAYEFIEQNFDYPNTALQLLIGLAHIKVIRELHLDSKNISLRNLSDAIAAREIALKSGQKKTIEDYCCDLVKADTTLIKILKPGGFIDLIKGVIEKQNPKKPITSEFKVPGRKKETPVAEPRPDITHKDVEDVVPPRKALSEKGKKLTAIIDAILKENILEVEAVAQKTGLTQAEIEKHVDVLVLAIMLKTTLTPLEKKIVQNCYQLTSIRALSKAVDFPMGEKALPHLEVAQALESLMSPSKDLLEEVIIYDHKRPRGEREVKHYILKSDILIGEEMVHRFRSLPSQGEILKEDRRVRTFRITEGPKDYRELRQNILNIAYLMLAEYPLVQLKEMRDHMQAKPLLGLSVLFKEIKFMLHLSTKTAQKVAVSPVMEGDFRDDPVIIVGQKPKDAFRECHVMQFDNAYSFQAFMNASNHSAAYMAVEKKYRQIITEIMTDILDTIDRIYERGQTVTTIDLFEHLRAQYNRWSDLNRQVANGKKGIIKKEDFFRNPSTPKIIVIDTAQEGNKILFDDLRAKYPHLRVISLEEFAKTKKIAAIDRTNLSHEDIINIIRRRMLVVRDVTVYDLVNKEGIDRETLNSFLKVTGLGKFIQDIELSAGELMIFRLVKKETAVSDIIIKSGLTANWVREIIVGLIDKGFLVGYNSEYDVIAAVDERGNKTTLAPNVLRAADVFVALREENIFALCENISQENMANYQDFINRIGMGLLVKRTELPLKLERVAAQLRTSHRDLEEALDKAEAKLRS